MPRPLLSLWNLSSVAHCIHMRPSVSLSHAEITAKYTIRIVLLLQLSHPGEVFPPNILGCLVTAGASANDPIAAGNSVLVLVSCVNLADLRLDPRIGLIVVLGPIVAT